MRSEVRGPGSEVSVIPDLIRDPEKVADLQTCRLTDLQTCRPTATFCLHRMFAIPDSGLAMTMVKISFDSIEDAEKVVKILKYRSEPAVM